MFKIILPAAFLTIMTVSATVLCGCDSIENNENVQKVLNQVQALNPASSDVSRMTGEQVAKVLKFEYKVTSIPKSSSPQHLEATLQALGEERWDCFFISEQFDTLTISCKRIPYPLLKLLPSILF